MTTIREQAMIRVVAAGINLVDVGDNFASPEACNDFFQDMRWPDGVECVKCGGKRVSKYVKQASPARARIPLGMIRCS
jgi:hypothetical protein